MNRLKDHYQKEVVPKLASELGIKNPHLVPVITKIVLNVGTGKSASDNRTNEVVVNSLRKISGQIPIVTRAKRSIAGFKLRAGQKIGYKVTLRGERMYEFLDRLISIGIPRMRDFHGLPRRSLDGNGNYTIGVNDQATFPELSFEDTSLTHGLEISIITSTRDRKAGERLLELMGLPLERVG